MATRNKVATTASSVNTNNKSVPGNTHKEDAPKGPSINITAPRPYRRAGMKFGKQPVTVLLDDLGEEKLEILKDDPVLVIRQTPEAEE